jgi:hypothetical protein
MKSLHGQGCQGTVILSFISVVKRIEGETCGIEETEDRKIFKAMLKEFNAVNFQAGRIFETSVNDD